MSLVYLLICTTGLVAGHPPELCAVYELRPQYEMTQDVIEEKIDRICAKAHEASAKYGGKVTKCEEIDAAAKQEFDITASRFLPTARVYIHPRAF